MLATSSSSSALDARYLACISWPIQTCQLDELQLTNKMMLTSNLVSHWSRSCSTRWTWRSKCSALTSTCRNLCTDLRWSRFGGSNQKRHTSVPSLWRSFPQHPTPLLIVVFSATVFRSLICGDLHPRWQTSTMWALVRPCPSQHRLERAYATEMISPDPFRGVTVPVSCSWFQLPLLSRQHCQLRREVSWVSRRLS